MSKIIFHFSSFVCFILLLSVANINHTQAMDDVQLTLGQRIVKEAKSAPGYEPKNYGRHTRKKRGRPQPQPQHNQQALQAQQAAARQAALQRAQQLQAQREAEEKARRKNQKAVDTQQQQNTLMFAIKQFSDSFEIPNDELWQNVPKFLEETDPSSIFHTQFASLTKDAKEDFAKTYIYEKKPSLIPLLEELECPSSAPERTVFIPQHHCLPFKQELLFMTGLEFFQFKYEMKGQKVDLAAISVVNASGLAYDLEDNHPLRLNKNEMLKRLNKGIDGFWSGVDCFEVVTGNYGRYLKGKQSGRGASAWLKQPAVITWSNNNYPLILVAFKGTTISKSADNTSSFAKGLLAKNLHGLGKVHAGFYDIADSCRKELAEKLNTLCQQMDVKKSGVQILFTGHSMGAGVAAISSIHQLVTFANQSGMPLNNAINSQNNVVVINLGQPRIWKKKGINNFKNILGQDNLIRLVTADKDGKTDPISGLRPNDTLKCDHFGHEIIRSVDKSIIARAVGGIFDIHPYVTYQDAFGAH